MTPADVDRLKILSFRIYHEIWETIENQLQKNHSGVRTRIRSKEIPYN